MWKLANHCVESRAVRHSHFRCEPLSGFYHHILKLISFLRRQTQQLYQKSPAYEKHTRRVRYLDAQAAERQCLYKEVRGGGVKHKDCQTGASVSCPDWCVNLFSLYLEWVKTPSCTMITLRAEITCTWCVEGGVIMCVAAPMAKKNPTLWVLPHPGNKGSYFIAVVLSQARVMHCVMLQILVSIQYQVKWGPVLPISIQIRYFNQ